MQIDDQDFAALLSGQPPPNPELLIGMTVGRDRWLNRIRDHYLSNYIFDGGSKVKVLVGGAGTGKSHLLQSVLQDAQALDYETVHLSAREYRLNDLPSLYKAIAKQIDQERLVQGLCRHVAKKLGYGQYDGDDYLLPVLLEDQGLTRDLAIHEIKKATSQALKDVDFSTSFKTFAYSVITNRLINDNRDAVRLSLKWLEGEKLERYQKQSTNLFERLQKINARYWLNSLIRLLKLAGLAGLVVAIDDLEVMTERHPESKRFRYTPNAIKDTCEVFRQMIDDAELLGNFMLLLGGQQEMIEDEKRGFKSYEALWMRLQTGLLPVEKFNPLADIVNTDVHLVANGRDFPEQVQARLTQLLRDSGFDLQEREPPDLSEYSQLRATVINVALMALAAG